MGLGSFGGTELIILLVIILLLFGAKRIPELAKGLGSGVREFRKGTRGEIDDEEKEEKKSEELASGPAGEDKDNVYVREEATRTEPTEQAKRSEQKR
jgi:sec-independent protein translocase protein TatA